jgi:hypothetical protein
VYNSINVNIEIEVLKLGSDGIKDPRFNTVDKVEIRVVKNGTMKGEIEMELMNVAEIAEVEDSVDE